ncbi:hypothetical protein MCHI_003131 [Candidatus Magnetoovum chiemensis]|nr:hypothetical protein MCHI_003131 [Candidatus Magnetoovum chiemensis]
MKSLLEKLSAFKRRLNIERKLNIKLAATEHKEHWIELPTGSKIYAHVHRPAKDGVFPSIIIVPGGKSAGGDYDKGREISADELASAGMIVLHYDPTGRGKTAGIEDYWGKVHQQELAFIIDYFYALPFIDKSNIGILSFSIGITIAAGALADYPSDKVRYLFDWEGPSNRINITRNDTHKPLKDFPSSNDEFWKTREAANFIGNIKCGYFRYQSQIDHVQGAYKGHAAELVNLATAGAARWTKLNDNPPNITIDAAKLKSYHWISNKNSRGVEILRYLLKIQSNVNFL